MQEIIIIASVIVLLAIVGPIYDAWIASGHKAHRQAGIERARRREKRPRLSRFYCPDCGGQVHYATFTNYRKMEKSHSLWCDCCRHWVISPIRINDTKGESTWQNT